MNAIEIKSGRQLDRSKHQNNQTDSNHWVSLIMCWRLRHMKRIISSTLHWRTMHCYNWLAAKLSMTWHTLFLAAVTSFNMNEFYFSLIGCLSPLLLTRWILVFWKNCWNDLNTFDPESELIVPTNLAFSVRFYLQTMDCGLFNKQHHS